MTFIAPSEPLTALVHWAWLAQVVSSLGLGLCKTLLKMLGNLTPYPKFWKWGLPSFSSCSLATQPASPSVFHQQRVGSAKSRTQVRSSQASSWYQRLWCQQLQGPVWLWSTRMGLLQTAMPPTHTAVLMKLPPLDSTRWPRRRMAPDGPSSLVNTFLSVSPSLTYPAGE